MKDQANSLLDSEENSAIIHAKHTDIFSVLGMHKDSASNKLIVRAFLPEALRVEVLDSKTNKLVAELSLVDQAGLFEGIIGRRKNN